MIDLSNNFTYDALTTEIDYALREMQSAFEEGAAYATIEGFDADDLRTVRDAIHELTAIANLMEIAKALDLMDAINAHRRWADLKAEDTVIFPDEEGENLARALAAQRWPDADFHAWPFTEIDWERAARTQPDGFADRIVRVITDGGDHYRALIPTKWS